MDAIFTDRLTVPKTAIDALGHVNNVVYLQWVQDIAQKHWEQVAVRLRENVAWVALDHFIEYKVPAFEGEVLALKTWVHHMEGAISERHTTLTRMEDNALIVQAKTHWCFLGMPMGKPKRIPETILRLFNP